MTKGAARTGQTKSIASYQRWISTPLLTLLGVWLGSLLNLALDVLANTQRQYPGPLRLLQRYPWQAALFLTLVVGGIARWQWQRDRADAVQRGDQADAAQPHGGLVAVALPWAIPITREEVARARRQLARQVRRIWIEGVLNRSLDEVVRIELDLSEQPTAIAHPWGTLLVQRGLPDHPLPPGTRLRAVASLFDGHLLILGNPGAGKTTMLLEYARDLLDQADQAADVPVPVVFHLSAWPIEKPPLTLWLSDELRLRYGLSRSIATYLVEQDHLGVLLDGLDEVPESRRAACVAAINAFRDEHGQVPLLVCARTAKYRELAIQLSLDGAVEVQQLDQTHVRQWVDAASRPLAGLRIALRDRSHWLWELMHSPLLLSIAALAYKDKPSTAIRAHGSEEVLFNAYVEAMLSRPHAPLARDQTAYRDRDTVRWLTWLAERMGPESVFYPDLMQPDWLPTRGQRWLATTGLGLGVAIGGGLVGGLIVGLIGGLTLVLVEGLHLGLITGLSLGLGFLLGVGPIGGLATGLTRRSSRIEPVEQLGWSWSAAMRGGVAGGLLGGLVFTLGVGLPRGLIGLGVGLSVGLTRGLTGRPAQSNVQPAPGEGIRAAARTSIIAGLIVGLIGTLVGGLVGGLVAQIVIGSDAGLGGEQLAGLGFGLSLGLGSGLVAWLLNGGGVWLRHQLLLTLLQRDGLIPVDLIDFLDFADNRILLRRVGSGYLFIHRLLQDYFANRASSMKSPRSFPSEEGSSPQHA